MLEREEAPVSTIGALESRLRVLAGCGATIIAGWAVLVTTQIFGSTGIRALFWAGACFACLYVGGYLFARALGRQRSRLTWALPAAYSLMLPLYLFLAHVGSPPASPPGVRNVFQPDGNNLPLAIASVVALFIFATLGFALEPKRAGSPR